MDAVARTHLRLPGTRNLRDLGGLPVATGGVVRRGRLYRAEVLADPGAGSDEATWAVEHAEAFARLGIRTVVDLRSDRERARIPSRWATALGAQQTVSLPIADGAAGTGTSLLRLLLAGELRSFGSGDLGEFYRGILDTYPAVFAAVAKVLAADEDYPVLVHCMAGKDRTGLLTALVLTALGVPREVVLSDYALTGALRPDRIDPYVARLDELGIGHDDVRALFDAPAAAMATALAHVDAAYGGAEAYLRAAGLTAAQLDAVRRNLVEGAT